MIARAPRRAVTVGSVTIGGGAPISLQSMTKTDTRDVAATVAQIRSLADAGCDIVRLAVPDMVAAQALGAIRREVETPLVADIHFDHRLALEAVTQGIDKLRINPGNLRRPEHVQAVAHAAAERGIPIRVGVNAGSLPPPLQERVDRGDLDLAEALVESAQGHLSLLEAEGFRDLVVSLKAFDVPITVKAYRLMAQTSEYPLHLGITESGLPREGSIRSAVGLGILLAEGIGDTIRVSLGGPPEEEVRVAREILRSLDLRRGGVSLLCCPTCGRTQVDLLTVAQEVDRRLAPLDRQLRREGRDLQVAVMGCEVNGPGEAKGADVGIAAGRGVALLFRRGEILRRLPEAEMVDAIVAEAVRVAGQPPVS